MREPGRTIAIELAVLALLACPEEISAFRSTSAGQNSSAKGTILVDGKGARDQLRGVPVVIRVQSSAQQVNLAVVVESISNASFNDLPPGEYLIQVTASSYQPAQMNVILPFGQTVKISVEVAPGSPPSIALRLLGTSADEPPDSFRAAASSLSGADAIAVRGNESLSCPFEEVLQHTSKRLEEFVENVNRISAIEVLEHDRLDKHGKVLEHQSRQFNYVAIVDETSPGALNVDEYRDGAVGANGGFPHDISTVGMPSLAMIFHPYHLSEFDMTCEGHGVWRERPVWHVRFQQRKDRPARMSTFRVGHQIFPVLLKGAAWIDTENYQIVHLETELLEPIPEVKLFTEHQALDYGPVQFEDRQTRMWLPQEAEIYLDSAGRHFHHRHIYSQYRIFSVEVGQKIGSPK